jgi:rod shape-determining protein MreC
VSTVLAGTVLPQDDFLRVAGRRRRGGIVHAAVLLSLIFASLVLLVLERVDHKWVRTLRTASFEVISPVLERASQPVMYVQHLRRRFDGYLDQAAEIEKLKTENQRLQQWQWKAKQLEGESQEYRKLLLAVDDSSYGFATGRVIADGRSQFVRSALINIGRAQGVTNGYAVVNSDGFVGRIVETGEHSARVLVFTDINSRIPVEIGADRVRAIMRGDGDGPPVIEFAPAEKTIAAGDEVLTSGQDGLLPRGLPVGALIKADHAFKVVPRVDLAQVDFASVLFYAAPGLELTNGSTAAAEGATAPRIR